MKKRPEILFEHMYKAIIQIEKYIKNYDEKEFKSDSKTIDAVIRQFEVLGEAANGIPKNIVKDSPIPWQTIVGMRHKLIHDYMGVDIELVWNTASKSLGLLKKYVKMKIR